MLEKDILGTWICYKIRMGSKEQVKQKNDTSQWTFREDNTLSYEFLTNDAKKTDPMTRRWKINYREDGPVILINEVETYKIISLENNVLILESIKGEGMRSYYANVAAYQLGVDVLP
jgi:hypothetical protein